MGFLRLAANCLVVTQALSACTQRQAAAPDPAPAAVAAPGSTAPGAAQSAGVRIFIDPVTGELRAPTPAELAAGSVQRAGSAAAAVKAAPGVVVTALPGGMTEYDFGAATQIDETVCVQPGNSLGECSAAQKAQLRAGTQPDRQ